MGTRSTRGARVGCRGGGPCPSRYPGRYRFRGDGFVLHLAYLRIEFDFGAGGRYDGFSAFHLAQHVRLNRTFRKLFGDLDVNAGLAELERTALVYHPPWEPMSQLMYLTDLGTTALRQLR